MPKEDTTRPADEESLLTVREFAKALRMGESTVRGLIREGHIKPVHLGRLIRIQQSVLDEILKRQETQA